MASKRLFAGWQKCVTLSCTCTIFALICNIALLAWAQTKPRSDGNTFILWKGDCDRSKSISLWSHFGINILSSIILSGSNYAMQILVAPTRGDVDKAHRNGRSLEIGVQGVTNWKYLEGRRKILYIGLMLTSVPLHLMYNSVIFSTTSTFDYDMNLVTVDFLQVSPTSIGGHAIDSQNNRYVAWTEANQGLYGRLDTTDCYNTFSREFVPNYKSVIMVTNGTSSTYNCTWLDSETRYMRSASKFSWFCAHLSANNHCEPDINQANDWEFHTVKPSVQVQYCLAKPGQPSCTVEFMPQLISVVIACNVLKAVILTMLVFHKFEPLITIGDAIASFMDRPDPITEGWGAISARQLAAGTTTIRRDSRGAYTQVQAKRQISRRYFYGGTPRRWALTLSLCTLYWSIGCFLEYLSSGGNKASFKLQWTEGFGSINPDMTATSWNTPIVLNVVIANIPQLILSLVYVFYNGLFTCMLVSAEWTDFAHERKALRVTRPVGEQRTTYFLSLPYRFSVPLVIASIILHWLLSQSLFLAQVNVFDSAGDIDLLNSLHTVGWSPLALMVLLIVGGLLIVGIIGFGFRRYKSGIPLALSDSRAISAACHPVESYNDPQSLRKVQYGVMYRDEKGKGHVGFSSMPVKPLVVGENYMQGSIEFLDAEEVQSERQYVFSV